ncbi:MAG: DEAD/DEAH box helicase [Acidobacteria bacterium]|nr:DEAD/DEAH box helicase [Acidobacteriota bacterium]
MFANDLTERIKLNPEFWVDLESVWSKGIASLFPKIRNGTSMISDGLENAVKRHIQSASIIAQSSIESDRVMAQAMALYASLATDDMRPRQAALNILSELGNFPGHDRLSADLKIKDGSFENYLRNNLLKSLNTVQIASKAFSLTDFQHKVWTNLPKSFATAISAPTSAGKSFVILEYLCQRAIEENSYCAVFIAPTRALVTEIFGKITQRLDNNLNNIRVSTIPTLDPDTKKKQIFVLTQERLQVLLSIWDGVFDLVIVDEAQAINDNSRGMILQDSLETIRSRSNNSRFLFLAPGATGFDAYNQALDMDDLKIEQTDLTPVVQNRIIVQPVAENAKALRLALFAEDKKIALGTYESERGFANAKTRLAAVSLELGMVGGSLVYGTGPVDAETTAAQIASDIEDDDVTLKELSEFIKKHVHKNYSLAKHVLKGVGFHYGKMPSLLREALEEAFKASKLKYLVCTTTLFQGVNLPARNVFIDTPTRGRGDELDSASLWNFAGRAGRLGQDIVGNVFLVDYEDWENQPLTDKTKYTIAPSFRKTILDNYNEVLSKLRGENEGERPFQPYSPIDAASGLLLSKSAKDTIDKYVKRSLVGKMSEEKCKLLVETAKEAVKEMNLPDVIIANNWTVNPFGQARLLKRFREKILKEDYESLIPRNPTDNVYQNYVAIFSRINKYILGNNTSKFANKLTVTALAWMRGKPLPQLIDEQIKYSMKNNGNKPVKVDTQIRKVFEFVEEILRFKYVQLGKAYIDLLRFALEEAGLTEKSKGIYDFPLALELGVSSVAGQAFIELGLSRISASVLENLIPDSNPTVYKARIWLHGLTGNEFKLSQVILDELHRKGLVTEAVG